MNILEGPGRHVHSITAAKEFVMQEQLRLEFSIAIGNISITQFRAAGGQCKRSERGKDFERHRNL